MLFPAIYGMYTIISTGFVKRAEAFITMDPMMADSTDPVSAFSIGLGLQASFLLVLDDICDRSERFTSNDVKPWTRRICRACLGLRFFIGGYCCGVFSSN